MIKEKSAKQAIIPELHSSKYIEREIQVDSDDYNPVTFMSRTFEGPTKFTNEGIQLEENLLLKNINLKWENQSFFNNVPVYWYSIAFDNLDNLYFSYFIPFGIDNLKIGKYKRP